MTIIYYISLSITSFIIMQILLMTQSKFLPLIKHIKNICFSIDCGNKLYTEKSVIYMINCPFINWFRMICRDLISISHGQPIDFYAKMWKFWILIYIYTDQSVVPIQIKLIHSLIHSIWHDYCFDTSACVYYFFLSSSRIYVIVV